MKPLPMPSLSEDVLSTLFTQNKLLSLLSIFQSITMEQTCEYDRHYIGIAKGVTEARS